MPVEAEPSVGECNRIAVPGRHGCNVVTVSNAGTVDFPIGAMTGKNENGLVLCRFNEPYDDQDQNIVFWTDDNGTSVNGKSASGSSPIPGGVGGVSLNGIVVYA